MNETATARLILDLFDPVNGTPWYLTTDDSIGRNFNYIKTEKSGQYVKPTAQDLVDAWSGRKSVALRAPEMTQILCLDFDDHRDEPLQDIIDRIVSWFDSLRTDLKTEPLMVTSPGKGIHLWVFLDEPRTATWIRSWILGYAATRNLSLDSVDVRPHSFGIRIPLEKSRDPVRWTSRIVGRDLEPLNKSHQVDLDELPVYIDAAMVSVQTIDGLEIQPADIPPIKSKPEPYRPKYRRTAKFTARKPKASPLSFHNVVEPFDEIGPGWSENMDRFEMDDTWPMGSCSLHSAPRQMVLRLRTKGIKGDALESRLDAFANRKSDDPHTVDRILSTSLRLAESIEPKIQSGEITVGRGSVTKILAIDSDTPTTARSVSHVLLAEPEIRDEILSRVTITHRNQKTKALLEAAARKWIDIVYEQGLTSTGQIKSDFPDAAKRVTIKGKKSDAATIARQALETAGFLYRASGHWSGGNGTAPKRARYALCFEPVMELRNALGFPAITADEVRDVKPVIQPAGSPAFKAEVLRVESLEPGSIFGALVTDTEYWTDPSGRPHRLDRIRDALVKDAPDQYLARQILDNFQSHGGLPNGIQESVPSLPLVWSMGETRKFAFPDFRAIRTLRIQLGLPYVRVERDEYSSEGPETSPETKLEAAFELVQNPDALDVEPEKREDWWMVGIDLTAPTTLLPPIEVEPEKAEYMTVEFTAPDLGYDRQKSIWEYTPDELAAWKAAPDQWALQ